jgi:hypothetical protein
MEKTPEPSGPSAPPGLSVPALKQQHLSTTPITPGGNIVDMQGAIHQSPTIPEEEITPEKQDADSGTEAAANETSQDEQSVESVAAPSSDVDCGPCVVITMEDTLEDGNEGGEESGDGRQEENRPLLGAAEENRVEVCWLSFLVVFQFLLLFGRLRMVVWKVMPSWRQTAKTPKRRRRALKTSQKLCRSRITSISKEFCSWLKILGLMVGFLRDKSFNFSSMI